MKSILYVTYIIIFTAFIQQIQLNGDDLNKELCYQDKIHNRLVCRLICPPGKFFLPGMAACNSWLNCDADITVTSLISASTVKTVSLIFMFFIEKNAWYFWKT